MVNVPLATTLSELLSPYLRAAWRDRTDDSGTLIRTARLGQNLCGSIVAERYDRLWHVHAWTHPLDPEHPETPYLRTSVQSTVQVDLDCARRASCQLIEQVVAAVLCEEIPAARPWWSQVDRIGIEDIGGLQHAVERVVRQPVKARSLPEILASLGQRLQ